MEVKPKLKCRKCGYEWYTWNVEIPIICPKCGFKYYSAISVFSTSLWCSLLILKMRTRDKRFPY